MNEKISNIILFYEQLTEHNLNRIDTIYAQDTYFKDPFHEIYKLNDLKLIYLKMFKNLKNPQFKILKFFQNENQLVLIWDFTFNDNFKIHGNSLLTLDADGKIKSHIDYWDTASEIWLKIPILKHFIALFYKIVF